MSLRILAVNLLARLANAALNRLFPPQPPAAAAVIRTTVVDIAGVEPAPLDTASPSYDAAYRAAVADLAT